MSATRSMNTTNFPQSSLSGSGGMSNENSSLVHEFPELDPGDSWRCLDIESTDMGVLTILEVIGSISKITTTNLNEDLGDVEISAIDTRDRPELQQLKEALKKECKDLASDQNFLKGHAVAAFKAGSNWLERLDLLVKRRKLHLKPDHKYAEPFSFFDLMMIHSGSTIALGTNCIIVIAVPSSKSTRNVFNASFTF